MMKNRVKLLVYLLIFCVLSQLKAQDLPEFTTYVNNPITVNPAYTGLQGKASIYASYRAQWMKLEGAPKTGMFSFETIFGERNGIGVYGLQDQIGVTKTTDVGFTYSYNIKLNDWYDIHLKLGLSGGGQFFNINYDELSRRDPDQHLSGSLSKVKPNVGVGALLYSKNYFLGFSIPRLLEVEYYDDIKGSVLSENMHFYLIGGYIFELSRDWKFKPAMMIRKSNYTPLAINGSLNMLWQEKLSFGINYRNNATLSALFGINLSENIMFGYAYDRHIDSFGPYDKDSHEVYMRFNFSMKRRFCWCTN